MLIVKEEQALPEEDDPLYRIALEVERDTVLTAEMREWREALIGDGIRELMNSPPPISQHSRNP